MTLLSLLFIAAVVGIFYFRKKDKKKRNISIGAAVVLFLMIGIVGAGDEQDAESPNDQIETNETADDVPEESETVEEETQKDTTEVISTEEETELEDTSSNISEEEEEEEEEVVSDNVFESAAQEVFGSNLMSVEVHGDSGPRINIQTQMADNFTANLIRTGILSDMADYLKLVQNEDFGEIYISNQATMVDSYGNESQAESSYGIFSKETVDQINFENFNYQNIPTVADDFYLHGSLQD